MKYKSKAVCSPRYYVHANAAHIDEFDKTSSSYRRGVRQLAEWHRKCAEKRAKKEASCERMKMPEERSSVERKIERKAKRREAKARRLQASP